MQKIHVTRNLAGVEDIAFGFDTVTQNRGGVEVEITEVNAQNLPFDETQNLGQRLDNVDAAAAIVETYGDVLTELADNIATLLAITEVEIIGDTGNAATLEGQTLAQVRSGINAAQLEGQTLAQVRSGVNAAQLQGSDLAAVRAGINAVQLEGQTLSQVRSGIDAATLGGEALEDVRDGGNAATLEGQTLSAILAGATIADATDTTKGKVRLAIAAESKAGTTTSAVPVVADIWNHPASLAAWGIIRLQKTSGVTGITTTVVTGFGISSASTSISGELTVTLSKNVTGFATGTPTGTFSGGTVYTKQIAPIALTATTTVFFPFLSFFSQQWSNISYSGDVYIYFNVYGIVS